MEKQTLRLTQVIDKAYATYAIMDRKLNQWTADKRDLEEHNAFLLREVASLQAALTSATNAPPQEGEEEEEEEGEAAAASCNIESSPLEHQKEDSSMERLEAAIAELTGFHLDAQLYLETDSAANDE
jgi:hypothetical protein